MRSLLLTGLFAVIGACSAQETVENTYDNVIRVFMHEPDTYTLMVPDGESAELNSVYLRNYAIRIIADVPEGNNMWAKAKKYNPGGFLSLADKTAEIHIHSPQDINPGAWNHGKYGRGQTTIIE